MADALSTITTFINSPPAQLVAGSVLAGIVWKFFERAEGVLRDDTKLEIATWLRGVQFTNRVPWPETFSKVFDRVFGDRHLSLGCFMRSSIASLFSCVICFAFASRYFEIRYQDWTWGYVPKATAILILCDYISLLQTRYILDVMKRHQAASRIVLLLIVDLIASALTGAPPAYVARSTQSSTLDGISLQKRRILEEIEEHRRYGKVPVVPPAIEDIEDSVKRQAGLSPVFVTYWLPTFFSSAWLWLYAGSGFLLKAARHFDVGFQWFNRKFDIDKRPLQSIGLVSGALVAIFYWCFAIGAYLWK